MKKEDVQSTWVALNMPLFRGLWIASLISQVGTWMHDVGASWLMASLSTSPLMVSLVQTATALPMLLLVVPSGALADIVDRRKILLFSQSWMFATTLILGIATLLHHTNDISLLLFTFMIGIGTALNAPAWQAITPEIVPRKDLHSAITLTSIAMNIARVIGPVAGGFIVAAIGSWAVFLLNAISFLMIIVVVFRWDKKPLINVLPTERLFVAITSGFRYVTHSPTLKHILFRSFSFMFFAAGFWGLFPLYVKQELIRGPAGYGTLLAFFGLGAVSGASLLPRLRKQFTLDKTILLGTIIFSFTFIFLYFVEIYWIIAIVMLLAGFAWLSIISGFTIASQTSIPSWVRARALSFYILTFFAGITLGSILWGTIAKKIGIPETFLIIGFGALIVNLIMIRLFPLANIEGRDLSPSIHWPAPNLQFGFAHEKGPVLVMVEYLIDPKQSKAFENAMRGIRNYRLRDGAIQWGLYVNMENQKKYTECFVVASWLEHLRQHERVTMSDRDIEQKARQYHIGKKPPKVSHNIWSYPQKK